jgi:ribosomal protein S18 acetylase RimI-like enzyme
MALRFTISPMCEIRYRLYKPEDFAALYAIEELCFQPPFQFGRRYMQRLVQASSAATWIAEEEEIMAGFAIVEWSSGADGGNAYIATIEVSPVFRGRGIGRGLLECVEHTARTAGSDVLWLHVDTENATAIVLYEKNGYVFFGKEEHFYAPERGALIYRKPLTEKERE